MVPAAPAVPPARKVTVEQPAPVVELPEQRVRPERRVAAALVAPVALVLRALSVVLLVQAVSEVMVALRPQAVPALAASVAPVALVTSV